MTVPKRHSIGALGGWGRSRVICPADRYRDALRFLRNPPFNSEEKRKFN